MLRTTVRGKRRDIGLGGLRLVPLAEAREKANQYRKSAREGGDPRLERRKDAQLIPTFEEAARIVHADHSKTWKNAKHAAQWINTLADYVFPIFGNRPIDQIDTPDVLRVLSPIWIEKAETARRVRQRIGVVFDWAKAAGFREGDNPIDGVEKGLPKQPKGVKHHSALPYRQVPEFVCELHRRNDGETARLAFEFLILTACRTGEVLGAEWDEVSLKDQIWTIPAERMKNARPHRVPLSVRSMELLDRAEKVSLGERHVFPGDITGKPLSNMVLLMMLRRMEITATTHGFRSSFRDWASEQTSFPHEVCELCLAHSIKSKTEAAYRRGDLLEKRRQLMHAWAEFVTSGFADQ